MAAQADAEATLDAWELDKAANDDFHWTEEATPACLTVSGTPGYPDLDD